VLQQWKGGEMVRKCMSVCIFLCVCAFVCLCVSLQNLCVSARFVCANDVRANTHTSTHMHTHLSEQPLDARGRHRCACPTASPYKGSTVLNEVAAAW